MEEVIQVDLVCQNQQMVRTVLMLMESESLPRNPTAVVMIPARMLRRRPLTPPRLRRARGGSMNPISIQD